MELAHLPSEEERYGELHRGAHNAEWHSGVLDGSIGGPRSDDATVETVKNSYPEATLGPAR